MKTIKSTTARGARFVDAYNRSRYSRLFQVYGSYSTAKACAEQDCRRWCYEENGHDFRIISYNCMQFTAAWKTDAGLRVETAAGSYLVI